MPTFSPSPAICCVIRVLEFYQERAANPTIPSEEERLRAQGRLR
jgi:hypothetical protein